MSKSLDQTEELMRSDLYEILGVEFNADLKTIKRAYRKEALKCHPDKNPDDPKAAELFQKLSKVLEILMDSEARSAYDKLLRARKAAQLRARAYDKERKKLKDDLENRERAAAASAEDVRQDAAELQRTIERLRREGSRQLREEQELLRKELSAERDMQATGTCPATVDSRVKVRWSVDSVQHDSASLTSVMSKYGEVCAVVVSSRRPGSALVEFAHETAAVNAAKFERGTLSAPLKVRRFTSSTAEEYMSSAGVTVNTSGSIDPPAATSRAALDTFESIVLRNMRQATERQRLIEQIQEEDSSVG